MKTIKHSMLKRYAAVAQEAEFQRKFALAESLTQQLQRHAQHVRSDEEGYHYSSEELDRDVKDCMWDAITRLADYYQVSLDDEFLEDLASSMASSLKEEFCAHHDVVSGAYEEPLAGEEIEVQMEDED